MSRVHPSSFFVLKDFTTLDAAHSVDYYYYYIPAGRGNPLEVELVNPDQFSSTLTISRLSPRKFQTCRLSLPGKLWRLSLDDRS